MNDNVDINILKLVSGEEIISVVAIDSAINALYQHEVIFITDPRLVVEGHLGGPWISGMLEETPFANQPIPLSKVLGRVQKTHIRPALLQRYEEEVGLKPKTTRGSLWRRGV